MDEINQTPEDEVIAEPAVEAAPATEAVPEATEVVAPETEEAA